VAGEPGQVVVGREQHLGHQSPYVAAPRGVQRAAPAPVGTDSDGPTSWPLNALPAHRRQPPNDGLAIGHRHLYCLLSVHDLLRRRDVTAAFRLLTEEQIADALDACAYFDLHDLAAVVAEIPLAAASPVSAQVFDAEYRRRFTMTDRIVTAMREHVATRSDDFPTDAT
jgi:hypothetical protein